MAVPAGSPASSGILLDPSAPRFTTHDPAELLAHFYYVVNSAAAVNYCCMAGLAWAVYDQLLTLGDEIEYIWRRPSRFTDSLFFLTRYIGFASLAIIFASYLLPDTSDLFWVATSTPSEYLNAQSAWVTRLAPGLEFALLWIVEVILQLRVHALYGNIRLTILNAGLFLAEIVLMLMFWVLRPIMCSQTVGFVGSQGAFQSRCADGSEGVILPLYWIPAIMYELWLVGLALAKLGPRLKEHDIVTALVLDSLIYFVLIAVVMGAHIALAFSGLFAHGLSFVVASQTIGGTRLMLHLRGVHYRGIEESEHQGHARAETQVGMQFADESFFAIQGSGDHL